MKFASWNVNSLKVRLPQLSAWIADAQPDVLGLQETKLEDEKFPLDQIRALGYHAAFSGQRTYNGVALLTKTPATDVVNELAPGFDPQRRVLAATVGDTRVVNFYVVNGQSVGSDKFAYKLSWLDAAHEFLRGELAKHPNVVVMGDFNIAPEDRDVHDPDAWREQVLCSTPERAALTKIRALGFHDSFREREAEGGHYSWWDYRMGAFRRNLGLRIDLIFVSDPMRARVKGAGIDRGVRREERPSDHAPVWAELDS